MSSEAAPRGRSPSRRLEASRLDTGATCEHLELEGVWVVDPTTGREGPADVLVDDGVLKALDWKDSKRRTPEDLVVAPGFTDLHAHLREPGDEDAETIATAQGAAAHGGFTTICAMPDTDPPLDDGPTLRSVLDRTAANAIPVRVLAWGTATEGREGKSLAELGELADAGAIGFSDDAAPIPGRLLRNVLAYAGMLGRPVAQHAESRELTAGAEATEGLVATILGLKGAPRAAEESVIARDISSLAEVIEAGSPGARLHLTHLSTAGSVELVRRAKAAGLPVTCDVTPHHLALTDEWIAGARRWSWQADGANPWADRALKGTPFDPNLRVDPPLRTASDARALLAGLADGTIDAIATDHAPRRLVDKEVEFGLAEPGIAGLETALGLVLEAVGSGALTLARAVEALTTGPRSVLGLAPLAATDAQPTGLAVGAPADLVLFDPGASWVVDEASLRSLGKNTPLLGRALPGRVLVTIAGGRLAYVDADLA
jgi:dihydroorotase